MNDKQIELLERVLSTIGQSADHVIDQYTIWHIGAAIVWCIIGVVLFRAAWLFYAFGKREEEPGWYIATGVLTLVGTVIIGCNLPDLFAPRAIAIHQLLIDVVP